MLHDVASWHHVASSVYELCPRGATHKQGMLDQPPDSGESCEMWTTEVFLKVEAATDGRQPLPGFVAKTLEFVAGDGFVCDALECATIADPGDLVPQIPICKSIIGRKPSRIAAIGSGHL